MVQGERQNLLPGDCSHHFFESNPEVLRKDALMYIMVEWMGYFSGHLDIPKYLRAPECKVSGSNANEELAACALRYADVRGNLLLIIFGHCSDLANSCSKT